MFDFSFCSNIIAWHFTCYPQSLQRTLPWAFSVTIFLFWCAGRWLVAKKKSLYLCKTKETVPPCCMPYIGKTLNDIQNNNRFLTPQTHQDFFLCLMLTNLFKNSVFLLLVSSSRFSPITTTKFLAPNIIIIIIIVIFSCDRTKPYELAFHITASVSCFTRLVSNKTYIRTCSLRVNRRPKCPWSDCILCIPLILGSSPNKGGYIGAVKQ